MADWKKDPKSMNLDQLKDYKTELEKGGHGGGKHYGKVIDLIKTMTPENYGEETVTSAYKKLSSGVTTTGGWTEQNLPELNARGIYPNLQDPNAMGGGNLAGYLDSYQNSVYGAASSPELREQISAQLEPDMEQPEPIDYVDMFEDYREDYGVIDLETQLNDLKAMLREQEAIRRQRIQTAEGEPVAMGVIAGRVTEIERQEAERIDVINREMAYVTDQLNTAYGVIEMYMNFAQMTYQDAVARYDSDFNRNLQIYNLVEAELDEQQATARANLQTYQNAILAGNLSYDSLSGDQRAFINKLEVQAGLPMGFTASLQPDEKVIYSGTREADGVKYLDIIKQGANGQPVTETVSLGATGGNSNVKTTEVKDKDVAKALEIIESIPSENPTDTGDKYLSAGEINAAYEAIFREYGNADTALTLLYEAMNRYGYSEWEG